MCYQCLAKGVAKFNMKYLGAGLFREQIMQNVFRTEFLFVSVAAENTDFITWNNMCNLQYSFNSYVYSFNI